MQYSKIPYYSVLAKIRIFYFYWIITDGLMYHTGGKFENTSLFYTTFYSDGKIQ